MDVRNAKGRRRDALVKYPLLILLCYRVFIWFKQKLGPIRVIGLNDGKPLEFPHRDVVLLHKAEGLRVEPQGFVLITYENAGECNAHIWSPFLFIMSLEPSVHYSPEGFIVEDKHPILATLL